MVVSWMTMNPLVPFRKEKHQINKSKKTKNNEKIKWYKVNQSLQHIEVKVIKVHHQSHCHHSFAKMSRPIVFDQLI